MTFSTVKRFIAGVTCPKCSAMDKLRGYSEDGINFRECVACGFKDEMRVVSAPREIQTRVNTAKDDAVHRVDPIKLIDN